MEGLQLHCSHVIIDHYSISSNAKYPVGNLYSDEHDCCNTMVEGIAQHFNNKHFNHSG